MLTNRGLSRGTRGIFRIPGSGVSKCAQSPPPTRAGGQDDVSSQANFLKWKNIFRQIGAGAGVKCSQSVFQPIAWICAVLILFNTPCVTKTFPPVNYSRRAIIHPQNIVVEKNREKHVLHKQKKQSEQHIEKRFLREQKKGLSFWILHLVFFLRCKTALIVSRTRNKLETNTFSD